MHKLVNRWIHLDFHTSEKIPGIGADFNAEEFVDTLKRAHVGSVTVFSKCHHGMIYHDTKFPAKHPHLTCNLLAEQIQACHKADIRCPIYISVGLDEYMAAERPEWLEVDENRRISGPPVLEAGWKKFCFASPYIDYVIAQTEEVLDLFGDEVDGFFFDIIGQGGVFGKWALPQFARHGLNPADPAHQNRLREIIVNSYRERIVSAIRAKNKKCLIFHNSGHIYPSWRPILHTYTHLELESLPSGGWGYAHFPITVRYARTLGLDYTGCTGKFALTWGHFNSYKPQAALEYECFNMLANGAKCAVGDQLHPRGVLDKATYELIGAVYSQVEAKEAWCMDVEPVVEIGVYNVEATGREDGRVDSAALGAYRMLLESRHQFDFVDGENNWSKYRVIILPDKILLDEALAQKVDEYVTSGGSLILSHESGLDLHKTHFAPDCAPVSYHGELPYSPDFLDCGDTLQKGILDAEYVMYDRGLKVQPVAGAEVLAGIWEPYFNRTWEHFCSHFHTPPDKKGSDPGVVRKGRVIYFAHPIFGSFGKTGMPAYKYMLLNALKELLPDPLVVADAPSTLHITWNRQPEQKRSVAHLLHYIPERRTLGPDIIEDAIPLYDVAVRLKTAKPSRVYLAPEGQDLPFTVEGEYIAVTVPAVKGHAMVVIEE